MVFLITHFALGGYPFCQGNCSKNEEARRAKSAKQAKDSQRGFIQPIDEPINISFEEISSQIAQQSKLESGKP